MRELDDLLLRYLDRRFDSADTREKSAFEALLTLPDPELAGYLLKKQVPESPEIACVVEQILSDGPS